MKRIKIAKNVMIDLDDISLAKLLKIGDETWTEIVLHGDKQIYRYGGKPGEILWDALELSAIDLSEGE